MRQPNHRLAQARQRKDDALPEIARLTLTGHSSREIVAKTGIPKTTVLRWRDSLRRECATRSAKETMELFEELTDGLRTLYRKGLEGLDRSRADKETRTVSSWIFQWASTTTGRTPWRCVRGCRWR